MAFTMKKLILLTLIIIIPLAMCKSCTLVLDTTETMDEEIYLITKKIKSIFEGEIENFVLVFFNDPFVSAALNFSTPDDLINEISRIRASSGGDCPENTLLGIERALENSDSDSPVFVFTDAYSKEGGDSSKIIDLCKNKNVQVNIILTGKCVKTSSSTAGDVDVYYDVTRACSGNVIRLVPSKLTQAFAFMKEIISNDWTNVQIEDTFTGAKEIKLSVDASTTRVMVAISGDYLRTTIPSELSNQRIIHGRQIIVDRFVTPAQGEYHITVSGHNTSVVVYKQSPFLFKYGFTPRKPIIGRFDEVALKPHPDIQNYVVINVNDNNTNMESIDIILPNVGDKTNLQLEPVANADKMFTTKGFIYISNPFKIVVHGYDNVQNIAVSGSTPLIKPQNKNAARVRTAPKVNIVEPLSEFVEYRNSTTVACKVIADPRPTIDWILGGEIVSSEQYFLEEPASYISYVYIENFKQNTTLTCKATNYEGFDEKTLELYVHRNPEFKIMQRPQDQTIEFGEEGRLHCDALTYPEHTQKWYLNDTEIDTNSEQFSIEPTYLIIKNMSLENVGTYKCVVSNDFKHETLSVEVTISGLDVPEISVSDYEIVLSPGEFKEFDCKLNKGLPAPTLSWSYKSEQDFSFSSLPDGVYETNLTLKIASAEKHHSGTYKCTAENFLAVDEKDVVLKVHYAPIIKNDYDKLTVNVGERVKLECEADAAPTPEINWVFTGSNREVPSKSKYKPDKHNSISFEAERDDSGDYSCYAKNEVGESVKTVSLTVLVAPYIETIPKSLYLNSGSTLSLPCRVLYGNPEPEITWYFAAMDSKHKILKKGTQTSVLEINRVSRQHQGNYMCVADNIVGTDRVRVDVKVY